LASPRFFRLALRSAIRAALGLRLMGLGGGGGGGGGGAYPFWGSADSLSWRLRLCGFSLLENHFTHLDELLGTLGLIFDLAHPWSSLATLP
jgi:hypothetical protein